MSVLYHAKTMLLALVCALGAAVAGAAEPLRVTNQSPLIRIFGVPATQPARLLPTGAHVFSVAADWSSHASVTTQVREEIVLDGESLVLTLRWRARLGVWQFGVDLPYTSEDGGTLDGFIDDYHSLFGFPKGDRPRLVKDQLFYLYRRDGAEVLGLRGERSGVGDVRIAAAYPLKARDSGALSLHAHLKLPTGDSDALLGSGGLDFALGANLERRLAFGAGAAVAYGGAGVVFAADGDVLKTQRENVVPYGHIGLAYRIGQALDLNLQFDAHGRFFDSELPEMGNAVMISVGGVWRFAGRWELGIAVVEDIATHAAPDVDFHFDLRRR